MKNQENINFLYENIKETIYSPYKIDEDSELFFSPENIYNKENTKKLNDIILNYKKGLINFIQENSGYNLNFDDKSIIFLDLFLSDFYKMNFISNLKGDSLKIQQFITKWVGYLGSYLMFYIKKQLRTNPKIQYPIYDSYFYINKEKIFPYFIAMKKLSIDQSIAFYEYLNELFAYVKDEDFKLNKDYVDEIKAELKPNLLKWFIKN